MGNKQTCSSEMKTPVQKGNLCWWFTSGCDIFTSAFLVKLDLHVVLEWTLGTPLKNKWRAYDPKFETLGHRNRLTHIAQQWNWLFYALLFFLFQCQNIMMTVKVTEDTLKCSRNTFCHVSGFGWATVWLSENHTAALFCAVPPDNLLSWNVDLCWTALKIIPCRSSFRWRTGTIFWSLT